MTDQIVGIVAHVTHRLVKWAGEPPAEVGDDASVHANCLEIIDIDEAGVPHTVYKRADS